MSSYRRFISYMHQYQNGKKGINCGFVKIEIKNGQCILLFQLKKLPTNTPLALSFFIREKKSIKQIPIWADVCPKGMFHQRFVTDSLHLFHTNYSFNECAGIILSQGEQVLCGTYWDETGTIPVNENLLQVSSAANEHSSQSSSIPNETPSQTSSIPNETPSQTSSISNEDSAQANTISNEDSVQTEELTNEDTLDTNEDSPSSQTLQPSFEELWQSMQKKYPPLDPFEEGGIVEGIKISPSDLPYLQLLQFNLGANRFLLHGYKNYKHLLLGRMEGQNRYILGIPGVYDSQEQFMARMFGFPCFKPIRPCKKPVGQFGYWFRCIHS